MRQEKNGAQIDLASCPPRGKKYLHIYFFLFVESLAARSRTKIDKVTLNALKLTAIFSKRRKIGAS